MTNHKHNLQTHAISLRDVREDDLPIFFDQQLDEEANQMAAFTAKDPSNRDAFMARWSRNLGNETSIIQTILCDGQVVGHVFIYEDEDGKPEVSYWLGKSYWGQGIATLALSAFLQRIKTRASLRVLEKCGFTIVGEDRDFANARGQEIEEFLLQLNANEDEAAFY